MNVNRTILSLVLSSFGRTEAFHSESEGCCLGGDVPGLCSQGPKSEEEIARAKQAKLAKLKAANEKKAQERKKVNEFLKANDKKKKAQQKAQQLKADGGSARWNFSSDNGVGGDGRGG
eukprot:m.582600 g.582600  ORF g.582600 m.582600 type:complete len:118 (+) comp22337_c1_seq20:143-496(+)